jgi:hypothetical protein
MSLTEMPEQSPVGAPVKKRRIWVAILAAVLLLMSWALVMFVSTRSDGYWLIWPFITAGILALCSCALGIVACMSSAVGGRWIAVTCIALGLLSVAYCGVAATLSTVLGLQDVQPAAVLKHTGLPPIPITATKVQAASLLVPGDRTEFWLRFRAPREDIDRFVGGRGISVRDKLEFTPEKPHLPGTMSLEKLQDEMEGVRFFAYTNHPKWFLPSITHGCLYDLSGDNGIVIVDYDRNEVYVYAATR